MRTPTVAAHRAGILAAGLALVLAACTSNPETTPEPTTPAITTPAEPTPTATPEDGLSHDQAVAAAEQAVKDYLALFAEISSDPDRDPAELNQVASGRALDWATHQITTWRDDGHTGVGAQVATEFTETTVELDPDADTDLSHPTVELTACIDLSDTDIVDADGHSVVPAERVDRVLVDYTVADLGWPDEPMWRVIADDDHLTDTDPPEFVPCD
jgi:hypothetical protein